MSKPLRRRLEKKPEKSKHVDFQGKTLDDLAEEYSPEKGYELLYIETSSGRRIYPGGGPSKMNSD